MYAAKPIALAEYMLRGFNRMIAKPYTIEQLARAIDDVLEIN
jgi:hypothetical protein